MSNSTGAGENGDGLVLVAMPLQRQRLTAGHVQGLADVGALDDREDLLVTLRLVKRARPAGLMVVRSYGPYSRSVADRQRGRCCLVGRVPLSFTHE